MKNERVSFVLFTALLGYIWITTFQTDEIKESIISDIC